MTPRCDGCRYWVEKTLEEQAELRAQFVIYPTTAAFFLGLGACRRYPSGAETAAAYWCGEFAAKIEKSPEEAL